MKFTKKQVMKNDAMASTDNQLNSYFLTNYDIFCHTAIRFQKRLAFFIVAISFFFH